MKDEIIEELWRIKDQTAVETKGNTQTLFDRLLAIKLTPSQRMVNRASSLRLRPVFNKEGLPASSFRTDSW